MLYSYVKKFIEENERELLTVARKMLCENGDSHLYLTGDLDFSTEGKHLQDILLITMDRDTKNYHIKEFVDEQLELALSAEKLGVPAEIYEYLDDMRMELFEELKVMFLHFSEVYLCVDYNNISHKVTNVCVVSDLEDTSTFVLYHWGTSGCGNVISEYDLPGYDLDVLNAIDAYLEKYKGYCSLSNNARKPELDDDCLGVFKADYCTTVEDLVMFCNKLGLNTKNTVLSCAGDSVTYLTPTRPDDGWCTIELNIPCEGYISDDFSVCSLSLEDIQPQND